MNIELSLEDDEREWRWGHLQHFRGIRGNISRFKWENFEIEGEVMMRLDLQQGQGFNGLQCCAEKIQFCGHGCHWKVLGREGMCFGKLTVEID